eukprot:11217101-Heterocapsa_arctica.AAC.1
MLGRGEQQQRRRRRRQQQQQQQFLRSCLGSVSIAGLHCPSGAHRQCSGLIAPSGKRWKTRRSAVGRRENIGANQTIISLSVPAYGNG